MEFLDIPEAIGVNDVPVTVRGKLVLLAACEEGFLQLAYENAVLGAILGPDDEKPMLPPRIRSGDRRETVAPAAVRNEVFPSGPLFVGVYINFP